MPAPERRAAGGAEELRIPVAARFVGGEQLCSLGDAQRPRLGPSRAGSCRPGSPLAARAVAVAGRQKRSIDLEADGTAHTASGEHGDESSRAAVGGVGGTVSLSRSGNARLHCPQPPRARGSRSPRRLRPLRRHARDSDGADGRLVLPVPRLEPVPRVGAAHLRGRCVRTRPAGDRRSRDRAPPALAAVLPERAVPADRLHPRRRKSVDDAALVRRADACRRLRGRRSSWDSRRSIVVQIVVRGVVGAAGRGSSSPLRSRFRASASTSGGSCASTAGMRSCARGGSRTSSATSSRTHFTTLEWLPCSWSSLPSCSWGTSFCMRSSRWGWSSGKQVGACAADCRTTPAGYDASWPPALPFASNTAFPEAPCRMPSVWRHRFSKSLPPT